MDHFYTDEVNTLILISLLKAHGIRKIIVSPGTTNISFVGSVQNDPFFEIFSAVDERAAGFMACGLAEECEEPVVLSCTGATASRNYLPGLTEAYYRHLPVLAVTSTQHSGRVGNYVAQVIDRSQQFPDLVKKSVQLYTVYSTEDKEHCITKVNDALLELTHGTYGPVHINLFTTYSDSFTVKDLPKYRAIRRVTNCDFPQITAATVGVFIGAHIAFSKEETDAIDKFCEHNNAVVICDQISNYRGKYRFLANLVNSQSGYVETRMFDLIIYIGYVHGAYINFKGKELWRVNPDGVVRDPYRNLTYVFQMEELTFFKHYCDGNKGNILNEKCKLLTKQIMQAIPDLPFSNMWVAKETASLIPNNSILHISILNSLRVWNYFETNSEVQCYSNSGGYGIDGCLSSFWGSALANKDKEHYIIIGDLSFFYDMNTMLNVLPGNVHILLVNNGVGTEFKNYNHRAANFGEAANAFIAAKGHNGFKSGSIVKTFCEDLGVQYLSASSKTEYQLYREKWLSPGSGPILYEIFTSDKDESDALRMMNNIIQDQSFTARIKRSAVGRVIKKLIRGS